MVLQKRVVRIVTFSKYDEHSSPLLKQLHIIKLFVLIFVENAIFMHDFYSRKLTSSFDNFFTRVKNVVIVLTEGCSYYSTVPST